MGKIDIGPSHKKEIEKLVKEKEAEYKKQSTGLTMKKPGSNIKKSKVTVGGEPLFNSINNSVFNYNKQLRNITNLPVEVMKSIKTLSKKYVDTLTTKSYIAGWEALAWLNVYSPNELESPQYSSAVQENLNAFENQDLAIAPCTNPRENYAKQYELLTASLYMNIDLKTSLEEPLNKEFAKLMGSDYKSQLDAITGENTYAIFDPETIYTKLVVKKKLKENALQNAAEAIANAYKSMLAKLTDLEPALKEPLPLRQQALERYLTDVSAEQTALSNLGTAFKKYMEEKKKADKKKKKEK